MQSLNYNRAIKVIVYLGHLFNNAEQAPCYVKTGGILLSICLPLLFAAGYVDP